MLSKMPEEVRGPLLEENKQMVVVQGLIEHALEEEKAEMDECRDKPRREGLARGGQSLY